ncbi:hypothetical protein [Taklimakanibacter albus]|uniref:Uncharacterized protein n=1 Tax=Taklimakanibacter albus TaxID=2800327 RepID=A0ACC5R887_9HYPH|nr:hypothetical protein [Aestuariivirga sp. YIM B02566]MBK1868822.1 hypothetical protein [Aestuariivirga sp. YIM B02566]
MAVKTDLNMDGVQAVLRKRAGELEKEFLSRLQQYRIDLVKAREQIMFLEKGCDAAQSAMERARSYVPVIAREYECPNCFVRMGLSGKLFESPEGPSANAMTCRKCGTRFHVETDE